jgi:hypothetical protein
MRGYEGFVFMGTSNRLVQLREHRMEMDRLLKIAVESGVITRREAGTVNHQYAKSGEAGREQIVQQVCNAIERQRSQEPEMPP